MSLGESATPLGKVEGIGSSHHGGHHWLELSIHSDPGPRTDDIPGDLTPEWGMHVVDMNVVMGDLQRLLALQGDAWLAAAEQQR